MGMTFKHVQSIVILSHLSLPFIWSFSYLRRAIDSIIPCYGTLAAGRVGSRRVALLMLRQWKLWLKLDVFGWWTLILSHRCNTPRIHWNMMSMISFLYPKDVKMGGTQSWVFSGWLWFGCDRISPLKGSDSFPEMALWTAKSSIVHCELRPCFHKVRCPCWALPGVHWSTEQPVESP